MRIKLVVFMFPKVTAITYTGPIVIKPIAVDVYTAIRKSFLIGIEESIDAKISTTCDVLH